MRDGWDDEQLLAALSEAMRARRVVSASFVETARSAYTWHDIDAELAQLTYDSSRHPDSCAAVRSEDASIRAMTFTSAHFSVELEVAGSSLIGQILPPQEGTIDVQTQAATTTVAQIDQIGCFRVEPVPPGPFRLCCRIAEGINVMTGWITL
jgi:hypothetical protein